MYRTVMAVTHYRCWRPGTFPVLFCGSSVLCGRVPACAAGDGGRAPAPDGESTGGRRASAAPRVSVGVVRSRPCEVQRVARARLDRPRSGWRASCCFGGATGGRPGVVFLFLFVTRTGEFVGGERALRPIASSSYSCDKPINTLGGGSLGSCVDEERSQLR